LVKTRLLPFVLVVLFGLAAMPVAGAAGSSESQGDGGNSINAKLCQRDGWQGLARTERPAEPFASEEECVSFAARAGTIVLARIGSISLTFRPDQGSAAHCLVDVHLRNFAPNTEYAVRNLIRNPTTGFPPAVVDETQVTTDASGNADNSPYSFLQENWEAGARANNGVDAGWTDIAC
jgi:hypothetical protein